MGDQSLFELGTGKNSDLVEEKQHVTEPIF